ncbi:MAG: hypothetical protein H6509_15730 [Bryobacterales bacterium]|nr:hypothetical protein [Acidobacteriota bacterium]MCB9386061.1 hypothetical protein [Bryobacterales bacterium]
MARFTSAVVIKVKGPFLTKSTAAGGLGLDAPAARNPQNKNELELPWTLVKGKIREAWTELEIDKQKIDRWLGEDRRRQEHEAGGEDEKPEGVEPRPSRLSSRGFHCKAGETGRRWRVQIDADRGSVGDGMLQELESAAAPGETLEFKGKIEIRAQGAAEADEIRRHVELALLWTPNLGGLRTIGFGRVAAASVTEPEAAHTQKQTLEKRSDRIELLLWPDRPFCFAKAGSPRGNLFESTDFIPGAALKAAVSVAMEDRGGSKEFTNLHEHLDKVRFTHALPCGEEGVRPCYAPKSVVVAQDQLYDVIDCNGARTIGGEAPKFQTDWKSSDKNLVRAAYPWPKVKRDLRVRTAIDSAQRRADRGRLFALETVVPELGPWAGSVDLGLIDESARRGVEDELLQVFREALGPLGKTQMFAPVEPKASQWQDVEPRADGTWTLTLQSAAILADPERLLEDRDLFKAYRGAIGEMSDESLELERFFSEESLAGGYYLHKRFQWHQGTRYMPYLLTEPGSVFLVKATNGKAAGCVNEWARFGLPTPDWATKRYGRPNSKPWEWLPYLRENGYGEVAINLTREAIPAPPSEEDADGQ